MTVELISMTQPRIYTMENMGRYLTEEEFITYTARVSNPNNQHNHETAPKLLKYLIEHKHWSPFQKVSMGVSITTSRAISAQILRHRSFVFQEFSQRYAEVPPKFVYTEARRQDLKNRQNSINDLPQETKDWWQEIQDELYSDLTHHYAEALRQGISKEQARMILPLGIETTLYMTGTIRSWIHYLQARTAPETQKEHRDVALEIQRIFTDNFPHTSEALGWPRPVSSTPGSRRT